MSFGTELRKLRLKKGITLKEAATAVGMGTLTLSTWERGKHYPTVKSMYVVKLAELYNVPFSHLEDRLIADKNAEELQTFEQESMKLDEAMKTITDFFSKADIPMCEKDKLILDLQSAYIKLRTNGNSLNEPVV